MVRALLVLCCSEIEMQILLSRPTSEFSHSLGQIRPSCSIAVYGSSSSDSCRSSRMPATAESGHNRTSGHGLDLAFASLANDGRGRYCPLALWSTALSTASV